MDGLHLCRTENSIENAYLPWMVVDENNVIQTSEHGMSLQEVAEYAGIDVDELEERYDLMQDSIKYPCGC